MPEPSLSSAEEAVVERARSMKQYILELASTLVAFDTTARDPGDPARDEARLQALLARELRGLGAEVDVWEPSSTGKGNAFCPDDLDFRGRPQLLARIPGAGTGPSLLVNGHIDAVSVEPREDWTVDPFKATVADGLLYGRGTCDMKGGIAASVAALRAVRESGVKPRGDIIFSTVTDEESSGAGTLKTLERGVTADAGIIAEPTGFMAWIACRGILKPHIAVPGRAGHAEIPQPDWTEGGAVNAIDRLAPVLTALHELRDAWQTRDDHRHPYLSPGGIVPVIVSGGTWDVTYPSSCELICDVQYLPGHWNDETGAQATKDELEDHVARAVAEDTWLREHPLRWAWEWDVPPAEIPADHPLVPTMLGSARAVGRDACLGGLDSWHDAAFFTRLGSIPTFSFGPGSPETAGMAHAVDECARVDDLVDYAAALAVGIMRFCGV